MADTTIVNRLIEIDTLKHLTVTTTHTVTRSHPLKDNNKLHSVEFWLPFLITILVFAAGQIAAFYIKRIDKRSQLHNAKTNLEIWVLQLEVTVAEFVRHCRAFSAALNAQKELQRVSLNYTPTLINKVSELNVTEFLNYSTLNLQGNPENNAKRAFNIIQEIEFLKVSEADIKEQYKIFIETVDKLITRLGDDNKRLIKAQISLNNQAGIPDNSFRS